MTRDGRQNEREVIRLRGVSLAPVYYGAIGVIALTGGIGAVATARSGGQVSDPVFGWVLMLGLAGLALGIRGISRRRSLSASPTRLERSGPLGSSVVRLDRLVSATMTPDRPPSPSVLSLGQARSTIELRDDTGARMQVLVPLPYAGDTESHATVWQYVHAAVRATGLRVRPALRDTLEHYRRGAPDWQAPPAAGEQLGTSSSSPSGRATLRPSSHLLFSRMVAGALIVIAVLLMFATEAGALTWVFGVLLPVMALVVFHLRVRTLRMRVDAESIVRDRVVGAPERCDLTALVAASQNPDRPVYGPRSGDGKTPVVTLVDAQGRRFKLETAEHWAPQEPLWQHVHAALEGSVVDVSPSLARNVRYLVGLDPDGGA